MRQGEKQLRAQGNTPRTYLMGEYPLKYDPHKPE